MTYDPVKRLRSQIGDDLQEVYSLEALFRLAAVQPDAAAIREAALRDIARQKKTDEMDTEYDVEYADFEGGYNAIIDVARRALPAAQSVTAHEAADRIEALTAERDKYEGAWMTAEGRLADAEAERDKALAANRGLVRLNEVTEAHAQRLREAGNAAAMELRVIARMDLMGASATAWNAACKLEAALKGDSHE